MCFTCESSGILLRSGKACVINTKVSLYTTLTVLFSIFPTSWTLKSKCRLKFTYSRPLLQYTSIIRKYPQQVYCNGPKNLFFWYGFCFTYLKKCFFSLFPFCFIIFLPKRNVNTKNVHTVSN